LAGDHIYLMDYRPMLYHHVQSGAELTVGVRRVNAYETHRYGIISVNNENRIMEFHEKPRRTRETLASMGIYIFRKEFLINLLQSSDYVDFGYDVLPAMIEQKRAVGAYTFPGYWADVGNVQAYWEANMSLLAENPALDLYDREWVVHTRSGERAPSKIGPKAQVNGNLLANGCRVDGIVERSILSPGVYVAEGAIVRDSVILNDTIIEAGAVVDRSIVDKDVHICAGARVGDRRNHKRRVGDWREIDEPNPVGKGVEQFCRRLQGQTRLAGAARTSEREQAHRVVAQQFANRRQIVLATN
jgi:glucose-1-phosphate adenylyltransferase